jgi:UDP-N-acetylglucosamine 2-epimerase (non-hydrolysing)
MPRHYRRSSRGRIYSRYRICGRVPERQDLQKHWVDDESFFLPMLDVFDGMSRELPLIFPVHPRTREKWSAQLKQCNANIQVIEPMGYLEFVALQKNARVVVTDSGGIQEETTYLGTPCLTLRENTERPITVTLGANVLLGRDWMLLRKMFREALNSGH